MPGLQVGYAFRNLPPNVRGDASTVYQSHSHISLLVSVKTRPVHQANYRPSTAMVASLGAANYNVHDPIYGHQEE